MRDVRFYERNNIELMLGKPVTAVDRAARRVKIEDAPALDYDKLLIATGGRCRRLAAPGNELPGIHVIRTYEDMAGLRADFFPGALLVPFYGLLAGVPAAVLAFLTNDWHIFVAFYWIVVVGAVAYLGPFFSVVQLLVEERHRATTIVIVMMLFNLVGVGLGSLLIGLCSDLLNPHLGSEALRWVLIGGHLLGIVPAFFYWKAKSLACAAIAAKGDGVHG